MDKKQLWLNLKDYNFNHMVPFHLWERIREQFGGPDASTKAFASKISRKLGWPEKFTFKAILEYKKFVYLGVVSDFAVTPSKILDQVWHEHILFNKAYRQFCAEVIQYEFDHNPELIPAEDQTGTFNAQFLETIQLYKEEFGIDPPHEIWGTPKYNKETLDAIGYESSKKKLGAQFDSTPLYMYFDLPGSSRDSSGSPEFEGFGGGSGGGAGVTGFWGTNNGISSESTSFEGDSGSNCSSSSCSSGCSGGD